LSAIKSYAEMLIDNEADTPALRAEFFNTINEEADRLERLIDNMLNISKIEIGGLVLNKSPVRTRKMLEDALTSVRATAKSKSIDMSADLPDDMPDVDLDKELIRVVVMNLLGNAIKYTDPGGSIVVSGEIDPDEMRVHVVDTGWGIPLDEQEKVFEKFFRGQRTGSEKATGNGLGLALAREIACLHGGDLRLLSEEGKGSKFTLHLPLK
jgi:signal transduction histidine kinase